MKKPLGRCRRPAALHAPLLLAVLLVLGLDAAGGLKKKAGERKRAVDEVSAKTLADLVDDNDYALVLFHEGADEGGVRSAKVDKVLGHLNSLDLGQGDASAFSSVLDDVALGHLGSRAEAKAYGLSARDLPALMLFDNGIPELYEGDVNSPKEIQQWVREEIKSDDIEVVTLKVLHKVVKRTEAVLALFVADPADRLSAEAEVQDLCDRFDISLARVVGRDPAEKTLGIDSLPAVVYFEKGIPSIYEGELDKDEEALLEWLEHQRTSDTIEEVTEEVLQYLALSLDYVAGKGIKNYRRVLFTGPCYSNTKTDAATECQKVLNELENVDDELDDFGIHLVTTEDIKKFPALGMFRNGDFLLHEGALKNEKDLLSWLIDEETLEIPGKIEKVSSVMLSRLLEEEENVLVLFYEAESKQVANVIATLEKLDEQLGKTGIEIVRCSDEDISEDTYGLRSEEPFLAFFKNEVPIPFPEDGNVLDEREVHKWVLELAEGGEIPSVDDAILEKLITNIDDLVVVFFDSTKKKQKAFVADVEDIDDDAGRLDMIMVKVDSASIARDAYGLFSLPSVVHFEHGVPNVFDAVDAGLSHEALLHWLTEQKMESKIEQVTGNMIESLIVDEEYVAVLFLSDCDKTSDCDEIIHDLESIDEELDKLDILLVYTDDEDYLAKVKPSTIPSVGFFRNGNMIMYDGSMENEMGILKFLSDMDNILLEDRIEEVGVPLLEHIMHERQEMFAFLYEAGDGRAQKILRKLEGIDDNLENDNILLVKCSDEGVAEEYGIGYVPRLIFFEDGIPEPFTGNLHEEGEILSWMSQEVAKDEIKAVSRAILERLIAKLDQVTVVFVDEEDEHEAEIISKLEKIHDDLREEELVVVQVDNADYERELGLTDLPTLVSFSKNVPCIYSGEETNEEIMAWLLKLKNEDVIEEVTAEIIEILKEDEEYVGVFFSGSCEDEGCRDILEGLESIDDELSKIGIIFVQTRDPDYPQQAHEISSLPALGLYRNGNFLHYKGDLSDEDEVARWFVDEDNLKIPGVVEEINQPMLSYLYETDDNIVVLFYEHTDRDADEIILALEEIDEELDKKKITLVKISEEKSQEQYGLTELPVLVFLKNGVPISYEGNLFDPKELLTWITSEAKATRIHEVTDIVLSKLIEKFDALAAIFYDMEDDPTVEALQPIALPCRHSGIAVVKIKDDEEAKRYGLGESRVPMPAMIFFHQGVPALLPASSLEGEEPEVVQDWLIKHKTSSVVEEVTDEILKTLIENHEYVGVFFRGDCNAEDAPNEEESEDEGSKKGEDDASECEQMLAELDSIDDELDEIGIILVTTEDDEIAKENEVESFPTIGLFRNGHFLLYEGDLDEKSILKWMTSEETLKIIGIIDEVNQAMLDNILSEENDAFVFFYEETDTEAHSILEELEVIDEKLDKQDLTMVKISDPGATGAFGIDDIPALVYFENGVPELYSGDLFNDNAVMKWMKYELKQEEIKEVTVAMLEKLIERGRTLAVVFYDPEDVSNAVVMDELENIDDDCARFEISFVKVADSNEAKIYGIEELPGLLYFENRIPSVYDGPLNEEEALLDWLVEQKTTDTIEEVTEEILEMLIEDEEYLAVFFSGPCAEDDPCDAMLDELESIDSRMQHIGIMLITTEERELAKSYGVHYFPALGLFKNGDYLPYEGDLTDELAILEWMTDKETLEIEDQIAKVNRAMLAYFIEQEADLLVLMHREGNLHDANIVDRMERVDDDIADKGVTFVRCSDKGVEKDYGLGVNPIIVHFSDGIPKVYPGDLVKENMLKNWVFESLEANEIEVVTGSVLDYLIDRMDNLAVLFVDDEEPSETLLSQMEHLDDDLDRISIALVKIYDDSKALEYGLSEMPAVIYFKRAVPGLYEDSLEDVTALVAWMEEKKKQNSLQLVSDTILEDLVDDFPYVAVLFTGICKKDNEECEENKQKILDEMEDISDDILELGVVPVKCYDRLLAYREHNISQFPAFGLFRNGESFLRYEGDLAEAAYILSWLSDTDTLEVPGVIEEVGQETLRNFIESEDDVLVFFYSEDDKNINEILSELETVDDNLDEEAVEFVRCGDTEALDEYGLVMLPSLVYFESGVPTVYTGDLKNDDNILGWISKELEDNSAPEVKAFELDSLLDRLEFVAVFYYKKADPNDKAVIEKVESVREEAKMHDIVFVTVTDPKLYAKLGVEDSPALVYYENNIPFLYKGNLMHTKTMLDWLILQRNVATIEEISDDMLEEIIDENEFVAVLFMGLCADDEDEELCASVMTNLEKIDSTLDEHGIVLVATHDLDRARELWLSRFPALAFFRNGEFLKFNGDVSDARTVLKWLTNEKTVNIPGRIVAVNGLMLSKLISKEASRTVVFFHEKGDIFAEKLLRHFEAMEDTLAEHNVDFLKISETGAADDYDLDELPALVYFGKGGQEQVVFYGDLRQKDTVGHWVEEVTQTAKPKASKKKRATVAKSDDDTASATKAGDSEKSE